MASVVRGGRGRRPRQGHGVPLLPQQGGDAARAARAPGRAFLRRAHAQLAGRGPLDFDDVFPVTREHLIRLPGYLELTSRCFGLMDREIPKDTALAFKARRRRRPSQRRRRALERHFRIAARRGRHAAAAQLRPDRRPVAAAASRTSASARDEAPGAAQAQPRLRDARSRTPCARCGRAVGARSRARAPRRRNEPMKTLALLGARRPRPRRLRQRQGRRRSRCGRSSPRRSSPGAGATRDVYSGEIRARHETDLAFRVGGKLVARTVDAGARVTRGPGARAPRSRGRAARGAGRRRAARLGRERFRAREGRARAPRRPAREAVHQPVGLRREAERIQRGPGARRAGALAGRRSRRTRPHYTTLVADADGVVVSRCRRARPGGRRRASRCCRLARAGEKEVVVNAPESQLARFKAGQAVAISLWSDPRAGLPRPHPRDRRRRRPGDAHLRRARRRALDRARARRSSA